MTGYDLHIPRRFEQRRAPRLAATSVAGRRYFGPFLAALFVFEGLLVKSFWFTGNDPVLLHYLASSAICGLAILSLFIIGGFRNVSFLEFLLILSAFSWSMLSSLVGTLTENILASATFALALFTCYVAMPRLFLGSGKNLENLIRSMLVAFTLFSAALWIVVPSMAYHDISGRFSGAAITVAVACNMYFFATVVFAFAARSAETTRLSAFYFVMTLLALSMLYFTYTRSSLLQAIVCLLIVLFTSVDGRVRVRSLVYALGVLVFALCAALVYHMFVGFDVDQILINLRLADGANVTASRTLNWEFGLQRISEAPWLGEGMLTKQTHGGTGGLDLNEGGSYNVLYDPHSLILSFGVQAGIPFAVLMTSFLLLVFARHLWNLGVAASLASAPFVIGIVNLVMMVFAGGDLTSMGSSVDRFYLLFVGIVGFRAMLGAQNNRIAPRQYPQYPAQKRWA